MKAVSRRRRKKKRRKNISSLTLFVAFSFACLIAYTIISQVIAYRTGMELSTLTTCFFGAYGGEVLMCALIKIFKLKEEKFGEEKDGQSDDTFGDVQCDDDPDYGGDQEIDARG